MAMQGNEQIVERERAPKLIELGKSRKIEFAHRHAVPPWDKLYHEVR
jgi:hypothetical protein